MAPHHYLVLLVAPLLFKVQNSDSIPLRSRFTGFAPTGADSSYIATREVYAFMPRAAPRFEFDIADLIQSSKDHGYASHADGDGNNMEDGDLRASNRQRQGATVRLLVIDTVPAMMLHKTEGPSIHVNMLVGVRYQVLQFV